ncbi:MAG TPA: DUF5134 domain-containing protein [Solirubrobacteraceae bacterium]|jgi:hypothetical protein|nr:DUF5134 domain-containing protein [Solirubrobacteraceae bacterium]
MRRSGGRTSSMAGGAHPSGMAGTQSHGIASGTHSSGMAGGDHSSHMVMNGMSMNAAHPTTMKMAMGGMSMQASHGATNILPDWLAVLWTLAFIAILVVHARHVAQTSGERCWWHTGHVLMALGMVFMYAPGSLDHLDIPAGAWPLLFANGAGAALAWMLARALSGHAVNALWGALAFDLAAMAYMWSPSGYVAPLTWLLVAYFTVQALLWASNYYRRLDRRAIVRGMSVNPDGTLTATGVQPLVCERDLRPSMAMMALGMAYMFAAMQLLM